MGFPEAPTLSSIEPSGLQASAMAPAETVRGYDPPELAFLAQMDANTEGFREKIDFAERIAKTQGVTADRALLGERLMHEETFYRAFARSIGAPFISGDAQFFEGIDLAGASKAGVAPLRGRTDGRDWLYAPRGRALAAVAALPDKSRIAITSPRRFDWMLRAAHAQQIATDAASTVINVEPRLSAATGPSWEMVFIGCGFGAAYLAFAILYPQYAWRLFCFFTLSGFIVATFFRLLLMTVPERHEPSPKPLTQQQLPIYTLIIALYREERCAPRLVRALEALNYPRSKLDVKFVVEDDDMDTAHALAHAIKGVEYEIVFAPPGEPRTKPRALNVALPFARGALAAIYDAEDIPEPDQLREAAGIFENFGPELACLQARLVVDNAKENWLTACYAIDYAVLFDWTNPGLAAFDLPIALGGTSNHFRVDVLRALGGWDAWNVTEDADLGVRLARYGLKIKTFKSSTFEEAPARLGPWMRQRTRWMKGRIQTAFVHGRDAPALWRNLGALRFCAGFGLLFSDLFGPLFWPFLSFGVGVDVYRSTFLSFSTPLAWLVTTMSVWLSIFGGGMMVLPAWIALRRTQRLWLIKYILFWPAWFFLLWLAAWRAVFDTIRRPYYWDKTEHGVSKKRAPPPHSQKKAPDYEVHSP